MWPVRERAVVRRRFPRFCTSHAISGPKFIFFKDFYVFIFKREGKGRRKRERNINVWLPLTLLQLGNLAHNPGLCLDWESNLQPFGSQAYAQSTELYQSGLCPPPKFKTNFSCGFGCCLGFSLPLPGFGESLWLCHVGEGFWETGLRNGHPRTPPLLNSETLLSGPLLP